MNKEEKADERAVVPAGGTNLQVRSADLVRRGLDLLLAVPQVPDVIRRLLFSWTVFFYRRIALGEDSIGDGALVGHELSKAGIRSQDAWSKQMDDLIGPDIRPYLPDIWESAVILHESRGGDFSDLPEWKATKQKDVVRD